jgi:hypothetical protein
MQMRSNSSVRSERRIVLFRKQSESYQISEGSYQIDFRLARARTMLPRRDAGQDSIVLSHFSAAPNPT